MKAQASELVKKRPQLPLIPVAEDVFHFALNKLKMNRPGFCAVLICENG